MHIWKEHNLEINKNYSKTEITADVEEMFEGGIYLFQEGARI